MENITIVTFLWGTLYSELYLHNLFNSIQRNTNKNFKFICYTDREIKNTQIEFRSIKKVKNLKRNLKKFIVFDPEENLYGQVFSIDLDVFVTGSLDDIFDYRGNFAILRDSPNRKRQNKFGGTFYSFKPSLFSERLWNPLFNDYNYIIKKCFGYERFYLDLFLNRNEVDFFQDLYPGKFLSYKSEYLYNQNIVDCSILYFHGYPKPHDLHQENFLVQNFWR